MAFLKPVQLGVASSFLLKAGLWGEQGGLVPSALNVRPAHQLGLWHAEERRAPNGARLLGDPRLSFVHPPSYFPAAELTAKE